MSPSDGVATVYLPTWADFSPFLDNVVFPAGVHSEFIWRGQRRDDWNLSTTIDRFFETLGLLGRSANVLESESTRQLEGFKYAARGRRGANPPKLSDNEWWALGQHNGLATPLLDWTRSPFAAAYFAFADHSTDRTENRVVYALNQSAVNAKSYEIANGPILETGRPGVIEFIDPFSDDNPRLVSQSGLFTRAPIGNPLERWVQTAFEASTTLVLLRIFIPDSERATCLRALSRMNINHLSLFPDLSGASRFVNLQRELE